jgi:hypothetical protein
VNWNASLFLIGFAVTSSLSADEARNPAWDNLEVSILHPALNAPEAANLLPDPAFDDRSEPVLSPALPPLWNADVAVGDTDGWENSAALAGRGKALRAEWAAADAIRASRANRDGAYHRVVDTVFPEPETFRVGRSEVGGGIVNAIKRRNPFCLLNYRVFWMSF